MSGDEGYPTVTVLLERVERLRRSVSHLKQLHHQAVVLLGDVADQVDQLPDAEDVVDE